MNNIDPYFGIASNTGLPSVFLIYPYRIELLMIQIKRIDTYSDDRFSQEALYQHGCFLIDDLPFEIKIVSSKEAIV